MKDLSVLIKPCSGSCNMRCEYCFYNDLAEHREIQNYGIMQPDTLEAVIKKSMEQAERSCTFAFQGGEPTLAGLSFLKDVWNCNRNTITESM